MADPDSAPSDPQATDMATDTNCYLACFPARPIRLNRERPTTIGRADGNTIVLADSDVSRKHALIEWADDQFVVRDLASRNGVFVNDNRVTEQPLSPDDRIRIGGRVFTFLVGDDQAVKRLFFRKRQEKHSGATDVIDLKMLPRPSAGFAGSIGDFGLAELLQALELGRKTGRVSVMSEAGRGEMLVSCGQVIRASLGETRGEEAVYRMIGLADGRFEFENRPVDEEPEILVKTASLLMEGFRLFDESHHEEAPADKPFSPAPQDMYESTVDADEDELPPGVAPAPDEHTEQRVEAAKPDEQPQQEAEAAKPDGQPQQVAEAAKPDEQPEQKTEDPMPDEQPEQGAGDSGPDSAVP
jgi:pSer/pThr/pTyr-binding forkhead associated (FHA) protein